jgi:hypothetical protein
MNSEEIKSTMGIKDNANYRVDTESVKVQKEGLIGWKDTNTRIDPESGGVQKDGLFGPKDTETRVNPDIGVIQEKGFWVEERLKKLKKWELVSLARTLKATRYDRLNKQEFKPLWG